ncbi:MAG: hypothetical protein H7A46_15925 [Verrucomicrobiales bacterium]|nr:hypothetical protein [Verrucomicrobiales bacterium]
MRTLKHLFPRRFTGRGLILTTALLLAASAAARAAVINVDHSTYAPGDNITVTFSGGPGNATEWIGIYPDGVTPGDVDSTLWSYGPGPDYTQGIVVFEGGLTEPGEWVAYLLENDGYTILASVPFQVVGPKISVDQDRYAPGQPIHVTFSGGPGNAADWLGVYAAGDAPGDVNATLWAYVPGPDYTQGAVTFDPGITTPGDWVVYLLENDGYTVITSATFTVFDAATEPMVYSLHSAWLPEEVIEIGWRNGPGNPLDWIGIYPEGVAPGSVGSTRWQYVDGTQTGAVGLQEGRVQFEGTLELGGYDAHLLENDGYTSLAATGFSVVDYFDPLLRSNQRFYAPGEPITFTFSNNWSNPRDWIGILPEGVTPGDEDSVAWIYTDGTTQGSTGLWEGTVVFAEGLTEPGNYVAWLLVDDGYFAIAHERITVLPEDQSGPRVTRMAPANGATAADPRRRFSALVTNGMTSVAPDTVTLTLDGAAVIPQVLPVGGDTEITFEAAGLFTPGSNHEYVLTFEDDGDPARTRTYIAAFTVADYRNIVLPQPLVFDNFDTVPEGSLPAGWTQKSYTEMGNADEDLTNLDSATYARWTAVDATRFEGPLTPYSQFGSETTDYQRVLSVNPLNVLNGEVIDTPLAQGRFLFGNSGYRNGLSQVLYLFSPDFDLSGQTDVNLCFYSIWEQNQDSIGAVEYSINGGQTWLPIVYLLDGPDVLTMENPEGGDPIVDAVATFTTEYGDVARYLDDQFVEQGGFYGAFIGAPVSQDLAPYISARVDNDAVGSKRIELFRLPQADGQARVRFRFAHAGSDSWYFGIDNFGLYSIPQVTEPPMLEITRDGGNVTVSWPADSGAVTLEQTPSLTHPVWSAVAGVAGNSITVPAEGDAMYYRLRR